MSKKNKDKIKKVEQKNTQTLPQDRPEKTKKSQKWSFSQSHPYEWMPKGKR